MASDSSKRKRKWDVSVPEKEDSNQTQSESNSDPVIAAALAAKKLNTMLATTGVANILAFEREVEINHCRPDTRYYLCKGTTHIEIEEKTGASIKVKGRYKPPGDNSLERPLHLWIGASSKESMEAAVSRITEIIRNDQAKQTQVNQTVSFIGKVYIGMEGTDHMYDVITRIAGPNNSYIDHIQNASQAQVLLRGQGSGWKDNDIKESMEPLHLYINAKNKAGLDKAKALCDNLCSTIRQEYYAWIQQKQQYEQQYAAYGYGPQYGYGMPGYGMSGYGYSQADYGAYSQSQPAIPSTYPSSYQEASSLQMNTPSGNIAVNGTTPASPNEMKSSRSPVSSQQHRFQEKKGTNEDLTGPKLPSKGEQYSEYSEPPVQVTTTKTNIAEKTSDPHDTYQGSKKTVPISRTVVDKSKQEPPKLVDYEETSEQEKSRSGSLPFWAAPSALDDAETNPLKQREKAVNEVESLKDDVYTELGLT